MGKAWKRSLIVAVVLTLSGSLILFISFIVGGFQVYEQALEDGVFSYSSADFISKWDEVTQEINEYDESTYSITID
ncbi:MAG: hypothetical protein R3Y67_06990 [Eubacteriales bacterium]